MIQNDNAPGFGDYAALVRRRGIWIITIVPAALLLSIYLAFALPAQYQSTATIILEPSSIPQELIKTTVASYADQQIEIISGRVMTPETLAELVRQYDPYPGAPLSLEQKAQQVLGSTSLARVDPVTFEPLEKSDAFSLHYQNPSPTRAAEVARRLADLFLTYHQRERTRAAQEASQLISGQADELNKELRKVDEEYAQLRERHGDALPDARDRNQAGLAQSERDIDDLQRQLRTAQEQESLLDTQLSGLSPNLMANKGDMTDLATVKAQLADAQQRYTPDHPDVKRLKRALAALLAQQNARGTGAPAVKPDNPEYVRVASQYDAAHKEVLALEAGVSRARAKVDEYTALLRSSPEIEREYSNLQRRRESLQSQYQQIQDKVQSAAMGQVFEAQKQGEHFTLLRGPVAASHPYSPNRVGLILLGLVAGCALAAIMVAIAESSDTTVRGTREFTGAGEFLLGGIPEILRPQDLRRRRFVWGTVGAVYVAALMLVGFTVVRAEMHARGVQATSAR
jgi:polysaccharide chain length determinant protein (PEP-CTERM system associated)